MTTADGMKKWLRQWWFSLLLIPVYVGMFHLWMVVHHRPFFIASGTLCALVLVALLVVAKCQGYFVTRTDLIAHALVVLDIWLEAVLITLHNHHGFYACAAAFILVLGAYRVYARRRYGEKTDTEHQQTT